MSTLHREPSSPIAQLGMVASGRRDGAAATARGFGGGAGSAAPPAARFLPTE